MFLFPEQDIKFLPSDSNVSKLPRTVKLFRASDPNTIAVKVFGFVFDISNALATITVPTLLYIFDKKVHEAFKRKISSGGFRICRFPLPEHAIRAVFSHAATFGGQPRWA